ncbi:MAG: PrsW family glutamic-type intramembrane protease [Polyangiaceae bacterium]
MASPASSPKARRARSWAWPRRHRSCACVLLHGARARVRGGLQRFRPAPPHDGERPRSPRTRRSPRRRHLRRDHRARLHAHGGHPLRRVPIRARGSRRVRGSPLLRTVLLGLSHCTFTTLTGLGFGIAVVSRSWFVRFLAPTVGLGLAMASHALHNGLPTFFGGAGVVVMILISWVIDVLFFVMLAFLVVRDRAIVLSELHEEVGRMLAPAELALVTTYVSLGIKNFNVLVSKGWTPFSKRRQKQLALVELAFVKSRRRRGQTGVDLDKREWKLRQAIDGLTREGVWIGN